MFTLSFSKILLTVLVVVVAWRGYRMLPADAGAAGRRRTSGRRGPAPAAKATDLVECVRCGLFVPNGTICRSVEECRLPPQLNAACSP